MSLNSDNAFGDQQRLVFADALRVSAIAFVIVHHAAQAYGPTGGFWPVHDHAQSGWFSPFYTANAAFGMGLMFLLAPWSTASLVASTTWVDSFTPDWGRTTSASLMSAGGFRIE